MKGLPNKKNCDNCRFFHSMHFLLFPKPLKLFSHRKVAVVLVLEVMLELLSAVPV